jgi:hypothetical protein
MPNVWQISLDAIYASPVGTDAVFSAFAGTVRAVDKTAGIEVEPVAGGGQMPTVLPCAMVRRSTLDEKGVTAASLVGTTVTLNSVTWKIINYKPAPGPDGEAGGEYRLILRKP